VGLPLLSALRNKNCLPLEAILTSLSAVPHAAKLGKQSAMEIVAMAISQGGKCSPSHVPSVAKRPKYRLNPAEIDQYIVAIAIIRSE
jgi:hypothetical protein